MNDTNIAETAAALPLGGEFTVDGRLYRKVELCSARYQRTSCRDVMCPLWGQTAESDACDMYFYRNGGVRPCQIPGMHLPSPRFAITPVDHVPYLMMKGLLA